jgi:hypothetical protein
MFFKPGDEPSRNDRNTGYWFASQIQRYNDTPLLMIFGGFGRSLDLPTESAMAMSKSPWGALKAKATRRS